VPSFLELVEETLDLLSNWTGEQAQMCTLASTMDTASLSFVVDQADKLGGTGMVEVDEELVFVDSIDANSATASVPAWGRAQRSSTPAAHAVGARVTATPRYPRHRVRKTINQVVRMLGPDLPAVLVDESNTVDPSKLAYPVPAGVRGVVSIDWAAPLSPPQWVPVTHWRLDTRADVADYPSGVALTVGEVMTTGQKIKVVYLGDPAPLVADSDDFATVTGYDEAVADLVVTAAASRLVLAPDLARVQQSTVEQSDRSATVPASAAMTASRFLRQEFLQRVATERRRVLQRYPTRLHYEGV